MASPRERRIIKELKDIQADHDSSGVIATPVADGNLVHLKGTFPAPPDTPYAGGTYQVDIQIPDQYPFKSPIIRFDTKIWHPNISSQTVGPQTGAYLDPLLTLDATGCHLSRYPRLQLVSRPDHQDRPALPPNAPRVPEPQGPARCRGGKHDAQGPRALRPHGS